jgi:hypothetical protein
VLGESPDHRFECAECSILNEAGGIRRLQIDAISSNVVACCTGKLPGFSPCKNPIQIIDSTFKKDGERAANASAGSPTSAGVRVALIVPPPGRVIRPYQTFGHQPVAVAHAFVLIHPTSGVGTSAYAICGLILTSRGRHCFRR